MKRKHDHGFPARDAIVAFIRAQPGKIGTREIAREFGLKNADRAALKKILRELADEGTIAKRGRTIHETAVLPPTVIADITGRDTDGELLASPTEWDEEESGAAPKIRIEFPRRPQLLVLHEGGLSLSEDGGAAWRQWPAAALNGQAASALLAPPSFGAGGPVLVGLENGRTIWVRG